MGAKRPPTLRVLYVRSPPQAGGATLVSNSLISLAEGAALEIKIARWELVKKRVAEIMNYEKFFAA